MAETRKRKTRKKRVAGTRAGIAAPDLLDLTCTLMATRGFHATTFQLIADRAGVSQTTILHYFKDRLGLARQVVLHVVQANRDSVIELRTENDSSLDQLRKHFLGNFRWARDRPDQASVILLLYYLGSVDPEFSELYRRVLEAARGRITGLLEAAIREGTLPTTLPLSETTEILHELLLGSILNRVSTGNLADGESIHLRKLELVLARFA